MNPTYPLATVRALATTFGHRLLTVTAETSALTELGMQREDVFEVVAGLTDADFYKTMESTDQPGMWQDVYRPIVRCPKYTAGIKVYCKVQLKAGNVLLVVISFKTA